MCVIVLLHTISTKCAATLSATPCNLFSYKLLLRENFLHKNMRLSKVEDVAGTSAIINKVDEETFYISR